MQLGKGVVRGPQPLPLPFLEAQPLWDPLPSCSCSCSILSHLPKPLLSSSCKAALLPEPGRRHFSHFAFFPSRLALQRPRQRFIPGPRLVAFGAGRAQGGADGPVIDRTTAPPGPVPPEPHQSGAARFRGSALTRPGRSPLGPPQVHLTGCGSRFPFFPSWASPAVGEAWGAGLVRSPAQGPFPSPPQPPASTRLDAWLGYSWFCPSRDTVSPVTQARRGGCCCWEPASTMGAVRRARPPARHITSCPYSCRKQKNS